MRVRPIVLLSAIAVALSLGCNDPTKGKTAATVGSAVAIPDAAASGAGAAPAAGNVTYKVSPEGSKIGFVGSKITGKHEGTFGKFEGTIDVVGGKAETGRVTITIDPSTLKTEDEELDDHLKSKDFFDVKKFPKASFVSTSIAPIAPAGAGGATHTVTGNLELHGVTRSIGVPATIAIADGEVTANAEFTIKRKDFGIVYPGKPDDLIKDEVLIKLSLKAPKKT